MTNVLLTGINGLLGTNLAMALLQQNFQIKGLVRDPSKYKGALHANLSLIKGTLNEDHSDTLRNTDIVVHIAAETRQDQLHYADYLKINYYATVRLFGTAIKTGVKKFIFVSTANTMGYGDAQNPGTEEHPIKPPFNKSFYASSKLKTENYLLNHATKIDVIIINPCFMIGAYDTKPSSGKIILMGWKKKLIFYPPGGKNFVDVRDVATAIINSFTKGKSGEKYLAANENLSYHDFFKKLNHVTNQQPVMIQLPAALLYILGVTGDALRFIGIKTNLSSVNMKALCIKCFYSNSKSVTELQVVYHPLNTAIKNAVSYFENNTKRQ